MIEGIKSLFLRRFHGASSINGFYYQIVNSVLISFDLFKDENAILTLEGIEDIDYAKTNSLYIQVKYRKDGLSWTDFIEILKGFAQIYEVDKYRTFQIITNNNFASSIKEFNNNQKKRNKTKKNFIKNSKVNLTSDECDEFFNLIDYKIISIDNIEVKIINSIIVEWDCLKDTSILIYKKLVTDYIEIAIKRENIDYQLLKSICNNVLEVTSTEEYNAFGKGLIERINWNKTGNAESFYLCKTTQPEHIGQNLDIRRDKWLNIIQASFKKSKTVIIKASSGQGKSALLYRYSKDNGIEETTFLIRKLEDETDAVNIERYLAAISKIGLPLLVLIDNLNRNTKLWAKLIARCESKNIDFLISVREEEWYKYSKYSEIRFEIISPFLDIDEAKVIFNSLKIRKLINNSDLSGLKVFDLLGEPKLLIEFIFLCTQGQMLEEKLKDQLAELSQSNNTSTKINIIRFVSLASVVGIELTFKQIRNLINLNEDIQEIIESLKNEYIEVNDKTISGFHLVRSKHLVKLLHSNYLPIIETAKELFQYLDNIQLQTFFSNLLIEFNINYDDFLDEFRKIINKLPLDKIIELINAVYKVGIHNYVHQNKQMIDEAYNLIGFNALSLLAYEIMPKREESGFDSIFKKEISKQGYFPKLKEISQKEIKVDSGIEYVKKLIKVIKPEIRSQDYKNIGIFLNWCKYINFEIANWDKIKEKILFKINYENIDFEDLCRFTFGLFRYEETVYHQFIKINKVELLDFITLELECYKIELTSNEITIHFVPILSSYPDISNQAVVRLEKIYMLFPYLRKYNSNPKEELFEGLKPSVSNNKKMMDPKYLLPSMDKKRNSDFLSILQFPKIPKTSYDIQKYWYSIRSKSITFMRFYSNFIIKDYKGLNPRKEEFDNENIGQLLVDILFLLEHVPYIGKINQKITNLHKSVEIILCSKILKDWSTSILNFYGQFSQFANRKSDQIKSCLHNFKDAIHYLPEFHNFFDKYFENAPDFFSQDSLKNSELKYSNDLYDLLELKFIENFDQLVDNPIKHIQDNRKKRRNKKINVIMNLISNEKILVSTDFLEDKHLTYLPIVYECSSPLSFPTELSNILLKLSTIEEEIFHYYWFIPIYEGNRYNEFGNLISSSTIMKLKADPNDYRWESFMPQVVPDNIIALIPDYKTVVNNKEYDYYANSEAIKANKSFLTNLEQFVSNLPEVNKFEKLLKEKYLCKINDMKQEILSSQLSI